MYENPGDELSFGQVYRQILQEAWLPEGAEDWMRMGKSRRGWRPTQKGIGAQSPSLSQADVRLCWVQCAENWREYPLVYPYDHPCKGIPAKEFWWKEKEERGVNCSYYDLYMRYCMYWCIKTHCPPPEILCYEWDPDSTKETVHDYWSPIYVIGGTSPFEWSVNDPPFWIQAVITTVRHNAITTRVDDCGIANIKVTDACGRTVQAVVTTPGVPWPYLPPTCSENSPQEITPDTSETVYIDDGVPPFIWNISGTGFSLVEPITDVRHNTLNAWPSACGSAEITVTDCLTTVLNASVRSTAGQWVLKSTNKCILTGAYTLEEPAGFYIRVRGKGKQTQTIATICYHSGGEWSCDDPWICQTLGFTCGSSPSCIPYGGCHRCLSGGDIPGVGCFQYGEGEYGVNCVTSLSYSEWEC